MFYVLRFVRKNMFVRSIFSNEKDDYDDDDDDDSSRSSHYYAYCDGGRQDDDAGCTAHCVSHACCDYDSLERKETSIDDDKDGDTQSDSTSSDSMSDLRPYLSLATEGQLWRCEACGIWIHATMWHALQVLYRRGPRWYYRLLYCCGTHCLRERAHREKTKNAIVQKDDKDLGRQYS